MKDAFTWIGLVVSLLIALGIVLHGAAWVLESVKWKFMAVIYRIEQNAVRELGSRLCAYSWWFSEDPKTRFLVERFGQELMKNGTLNHSDVRDAWENLKPTPAHEVEEG